MSSKKNALLLATSVLVLLFAVACAAGTVVPPTQLPTSAPTMAPTTASTGAPVEITFWNTLDQAVNPSAYKWRQEMLDEFAKEYPNIKVKEEITPNAQWNVKLSTAVASNTEPDVFYVRMGAWMDPYIQEGVLLPLNEYLAKDNWKSTFSPYLEVYNYGGKYYAVPFQTRTIRLFYNKGLFDKNGLKPPTTWDELLQLVKTLKGKNITPFGAGNKGPGQIYYEWMFMQIHTRLNGYSDMQRFLARDGGPGFTAPSFLEAAKRLQELGQAGAFPKGTSGLTFMEGNALFWREEAAMNNFIDLFSDMTKSNGPNIQLDYVDFPIFPGVTKDPDALCGGIGSGLAISARKSPEVQAAAATFVKFWTRPDNAKKLSAATGWITGVVDTVPENPSPYIKRLADSIAKAPYISSYYQDMMRQTTAQEVYQAGLTELVEGNLTPEQFVKNVEESAKKEYGK